MYVKKYFDKDDETGAGGKPSEAEAAAADSDDGETENDPIEDYFASVDDDEESELDFSDTDPAAARQAESASEDDTIEAAAGEDTAAAADEGEEAEGEEDSVEGGEQDTVEGAATQKGGDAETPQSQEPSQPAETPEEFQERVRQQRQEAEEFLAKQHYAFSDEEFEQFEDNPREYLPKVAARLYMDATTNAMAHMMNLFPQILEQTLQARDRSSEYEQKFFGQFPQLKDHRDDVVRAATLYRNQFPNADPETLMRDVGAQVMIAKRIQPQQQQTAPTTPQKPHTPAAAAPPGRSNAADDNFFTELAEEDLADNL